MQGSILIVDDNINVTSALSQLLEPEFSKVIAIQEPDRIPGILELENVDVVLLDMNFKRGDSSGEEGLKWLKNIHQVDPDMMVIMITAYGEVELAVNAMKGGANDFVVKPWDNDKLIATLKTALDLRRSKKMIHNLKEKQSHLNRELLGNHHQFIGESKPMLEIKITIRKVAQTDSSVLILGENGTGKELIAREIHRQSNRMEGVFIHVDLGAMSDTLFESELFGHVKGAFTDAVQDRAGRFEIASGGTIFLDEIGNLPVHLQSKLLSVMENREIFRLGSNKPIPVDIRIICATNQELDEMIRNKTFREDLYYRINTIEITAPTLRERGKDILLLARYFLTEFARKHNKEGVQFSAKYRKYLQDQSWPGNVRQLRNQIEKDVILTEAEVIFPDPIRTSNTTQDLHQTTGASLYDMQKEIVHDTLKKNGGNVKKTAEELGVARSTIYNILKNNTNQ